MRLKKLGMAVTTLVLACTGSSLLAEDTATTYNRIDEVMDWGAVTSKVIVDLKGDVPQGSVDRDSFSVHVVRTDERLDEPLIAEGDRTVVKAYVSDAEGNPVVEGRYATLVLEIGPKVSLGSVLNHARDGARRTIWNQNAYTITQKKAIGERPGGLVAKEMDRHRRLLVDRFALSAASYEDEEYGQIEMAYAHYRPAADGARHPLIVWLHGGGEGGTDATIPLSANRACYFAADHVQAYFDGAFVLVPQCPTRWMDDGVERTAQRRRKENAISIYTRAVQDLVASHVAQNPDIDPDRIYVGGASNGGFLAVRMILSYPEFYAAAFPSSEALNDTYVTDEEIEGIVGMPIWFVNSAMDRTVPAPEFCLKLYDRLCKAGAPNVYLSYLRRVIDESGLYKNEDGTPYEYNGHWSWIYFYNNDLSQVIDGRKVSFMEWLAAQSK